jgi:hypothetical protein
MERQPGESYWRVWHADPASTEPHGKSLNSVPPSLQIWAAMISMSSAKGGRPSDRHGRSMLQLFSDISHPKFGLAIIGAAMLI